MAKALTTTRMLLDHLESVYNGKAWHGPTLRGALRGISAALAGQKLTQSGHSIADIALHCAYWKYTVRRRLQKSARGAFPWQGSNWFTLPNPLSETQWKEILRTLDEEHELLCQAIETFSDAKLTQVPPGSRFSYYQLI